LKSRLERSLRTTFLGLALNVALTAAKFAAGFIGHSHALMADAVESLADIFSSLIVWRGVVVAAEPADEDHPYGHGKAEPLAAAVVSVMLLLAAAWIVLTAVREIWQPHQSPAAFTLLVLFGVVALKEGLYRFVHRESASIHSSALQADALHHRSDALTSLAAAVGISVSLIGGKGYEAADDVAAVAAAMVIAWNGYRVLRPALNDLMDQAPNRALVDRIRHTAETVPGVHRVEKCKARKMGHLYLVDTHVEVDPLITVQRGHEISHEVKDQIRAQIPRVGDVLVHIEPSGQKRAG
jgi:cation diffusion facilitator family transporter